MLAVVVGQCACEDSLHSPAWGSAFSATGEPMPRDKPSQILKYFGYKHLPRHLQEISQPFAAIADEMDSNLPDCAEKSAGLRKLLEAKDCMVRAALEVK